MPTDKFLEIDEVKFEEIDNSYRVRLASVGNLPITKALMDGKTVRVPAETNTGRLYRYGKKFNKTLRKHKFEDSIILWYEDSIVPESDE